MCAGRGRREERRGRLSSSSFRCGINVIKADNLSMSLHNDEGYTCDDDDDDALMVVFPIGGNGVDDGDMLFPTSFSLVCLFVVVYYLYVTRPDTRI